MVENQCAYSIKNVDVMKLLEVCVCVCLCLLLLCLLVAGFRDDLCSTHLCASAAFGLD